MERVGVEQAIIAARKYVDSQDDVRTYLARCVLDLAEEIQTDKKDEKIKRMEWGKGRLADQGCDVEPGPDKWSLKVYFQNGKRFNFWPYSGWFSELGGQGKGRGIANLFRCAEGQRQKTQGGMEVPE